MRTPGFGCDDTSGAHVTTPTSRASTTNTRILAIMIVSLRFVHSLDGVGLPAQRAPLHDAQAARGGEPHQPDQHECRVHLTGQQHLPGAEHQVTESGFRGDELY